MSSAADRPAPAPSRARRRGRRRGPRWLDFSIAATALVVSTASLLVARHQAQVMDRQLAASVWPQLEYSFSNLDADGRPNAVAFSVQNTGVGPLRIRSFRLSYRDMPVRDAGDLLARCCVRGADTLRLARERVPFRRSFVTSRVIGAGVKVEFFRFPRSRGWLGEYVALDGAAPDVATRVCYCSVLDDCWVRDSREGEPAPVRSCAVEAKAPQYR